MGVVDIQAGIAIIKAIFPIEAPDGRFSESLMIAAAIKLSHIAGGAGGFGSDRMIRLKIIRLELFETIAQNVLG